MAVPSQLTVSEGLMGGDNYREDDGAGHYLTGGSWSNLIGILSVWESLNHLNIPMLLRLKERFIYLRCWQWLLMLRPLMFVAARARLWGLTSRAEDLRHVRWGNTRQQRNISLYCLDNNVNWQLDRFRHIDTNRGNVTWSDTNKSALPLNFNLDEFG